MSESEPITTDRCSLCRYVRKVDLHQSVAWECHLNAPRGVTMVDWPARDRAVWPTVTASDWCGQFQAAVRVRVRGRRTMSTTLILKAHAFAAGAHAAVGQCRKYTGRPYIEHPRAVAKIVASVTDDAEMIAAALLHDVREDTQVTDAVVRAAFGERVADLVYWLTDQSKPADGNRATRKAIDRAHSAAAPPEAQTIKLADLIDNTLTIEQYDPDFAKVYLKEKEALLAVMGKGDPTLLKRAREQLACMRPAAEDEHAQAPP